LLWLGGSRIRGKLSVGSSETVKRHDEVLVGRARDSVARQAWQEAYELLSEADLQTDLGPEELSLLANAAYLSAHPQASLEAWERVHEEGLNANNRTGAAAAAVRIAHLVRDSGQEALFHAWVRRAEALLEGAPESALHGHLAVAKAAGTFVWGDFPSALAAALEAEAIGTRLDDREVSALAKNLRGRVLILRGDVNEGLALLDESSLTALSGAIDPISASVLFCSTICALHSLAEYERAEQLNQAMERFGHRHAIGVFHGWCRVHSAEMKRFRGAWEAAEEDAKRASEELRPYVRLDQGWPLALLGEIHLRRGDLPSAEEAMLESHELGWEPQPGFALLRLEQGDADAAAASIRDAIENPPQTPSRELPPNNDLRMAPLFVAQIEIALATNDLERAEWATAELQRIAALYGTKALQAAASTAAGSVQLAQGDVASARRFLEEGVRLWSEVGAPYEAARTRVALAMALRGAGNGDRAELELRSARHAFEKLGARPDAIRAARAMGEVRVGRSRAPAREKQVFMFTDIVKSTDLVQAIGDDAWAHIVRWHNETLASLIAQGTGEIVRTTGDGFFAAFADPADAIGCAVSIQEALEEHRRKHGFSPRVRIGLHLTEATREGPDWNGVGVHAAARIAALAQGEEILASRETSRAAGNPYRLSEPRTVSLKGISEPIEVVAVEWR
jgi:class 3 adenylate cyclase